MSEQYIIGFLITIALFFCGLYLRNLEKAVTRSIELTTAIAEELTLLTKEFYTLIGEHKKNHE